MDDPKVEIIALSNTLKRKMGLKPDDTSEGFIDPEAVKGADDLVKTLCEECHSAIAGVFANLNEKWHVMRDMPKDSPDRPAISEEVFILSHEIKDIGSMCGYNLIAHFAESLRDYIDETELNLKAQRVIIQAHIDAIQLAHKQDLKDDDGPAATELKKIVKLAIEQYK